MNNVEIWKWEHWPSFGNYDAPCDDSIRKGALGGGRCNNTVIIVGQIEGFFEAEVITEELAQQSIAMQKDVVRSTALNPA